MVRDGVNKKRSLQMNEMWPLQWENLSFQNVDWSVGDTETEIQAAVAAQADSFNDLVVLELYQNLKQELLSSSQTSLVGVTRVSSQLIY